MKRMAFLPLLVLALAAAPALAQKPGSIKDDCRALGIFMFDVPTLKITVVPQRIAVSYPQPGEYAKEVCFTWVIEGGGQGDKFDALNIKDFDAVKGKGGKPVFKEKKLHSAGGTFVSLIFDDVPDWDPDGDGKPTDIIVNYRVEGKYKGKPVSFDPEIIIQKPGG